MRLSDLLACQVEDHDGRNVGRVRDVRLVMDGRLTGSLAALRLDALIVGGDGIAAGRLGYLRGGVRGPWPLAPLMRRLEGRAVTIEPGDIAEWDLEHHRLRLTADATTRRDPDRSSSGDT